MKTYAILVTAAVLVAAGTAWAADPGSTPTTIPPPRSTGAVAAPDAAAAEPVLGSHRAAAAPTETKAGPAAPSPAPAKTDAVPPTPGGELVSPDAANAVDTEDLIKKLTGQAKDDSDPSQVLDELVDRMNASAKRLHDQDPGVVTQETQRRIVMDLDTLIELVRKNQKQQSGSGKPKPDPGDKKEQNPGDKSNQPSSSEGGTNAATASVMRSGEAQAAGSNGADMTEKGQEWGNLPDRDRDLIANSVKEQALPAYREIVQRYYQALAEIGKSDNK